ncbi:MAG TPA: SRPBCC family protein [Fibrobacteria bacterium]|nr:SRPBCC family protein [Fibrobacteria bacterium]
MMMNNRLLSVCGVLAVSLTAPFAFGAATAKYLKVTEVSEIHAPADSVWKKAADFGDLGAWHPAIKTTEILGGENNKPGAIRLLTLQDGGTLKEELLSYDAKKKVYSYNILESGLPVSEYTSTFSVGKDKKGVCKVTWSGHFKRKDLSEHPAAGQDDTTATKTMSGVYRAGLDNLKAILEKAP